MENDELNNAAFKVILIVLSFVFLCGVILSCCNPPEKIIVKELNKNAIQMRETDAIIIKIDTSGARAFVYWQDLQYSFYYRTGPYSLPHHYKIGTRSSILIPQ